MGVSPFEGLLFVVGFMLIIFAFTTLFMLLACLFEKFF